MVFVVPFSVDKNGIGLSIRNVRPLGARGLGVMTSLLQSEDHRFNSGRAHHYSLLFNE